MIEVSWDRLDRWWLRELASDPAYGAEIGPWLISLLSPQPHSLYLDLGCGEGRLMHALATKDVRVIGCDLSMLLLRRARQYGPVVRALLPSLAWIKTAGVDGAYIGLVLEHLEDEIEFFRETARVVKPKGVMALVINHPIWTAPESSPIEDAGGEMLWRPGTYFGRGKSVEPAGKQKVTFYHRTMADILNAAADTGWQLERLEERGISAEQIERIPDYAGQEHIPRTLGVRWRRK
ncbi:MAG: class I SAM-dependent methyltransferase [Acidimicrobiia bacterium]